MSVSRLIQNMTSAQMYKSWWRAVWFSHELFLFMKTHTLRPQILHLSSILNWISSGGPKGILNRFELISWEIHTLSSFDLATLFRTKLWTNEFFFVFWSGLNSSRQNVHHHKEWKFLGHGRKEALSVGRLFSRGRPWQRNRLNAGRTVSLMCRVWCLMSPGKMFAGRQGQWN